MTLNHPTACSCHLCFSAHKIHKNWGQTIPKYRSGTTSTTVIFVHDIPQSCHHSDVAASQKTHHPAMGSLALSLPCGKAAAILVTCKHRDSVTEVKMWFQVVGLPYMTVLVLVYYTPPWGEMLNRFPSKVGRHEYQRWRLWGHAVQIFP